MSAPSKITGGCLCGAVRYEVSFKADHDFKNNAFVCLCTQCRKQSGALAMHFFNVTLPSFTWTSPNPSARSDYEIIPGNHRHFCRTCGSFIAWQGDNNPTPEGEGQLEICAGTIDEEFLIGKKDADGEIVPGTGWGEVLCHPEGKITWAQNDIGKVTAGICGTRYKYGSSDGVKC